MPTDSLPTPRFDTLAPLLDRLAELAAEHLTEPYQITVHGWDDGSFDAVARHTEGVTDGGDWIQGEQIRYDPDREVFEKAEGEWNRDTGAVHKRSTTIIESYPNPIGDRDE